jgi:hypothetical protein
MSLWRAPQRLINRGFQSRYLSTIPQIKGKYDNDEWMILPRKIEGNDINVNWSLVESGVTNVGLAFRNAPTSRLLKKIGIKDGAAGIIDLAKLKVGSAGKLLEAGDNLTHSQFEDHLSIVQDYLSNGQDLFVEDAAIGSHPSFRLGVRVITHSAEVALAYRSLLFAIPPQKVNQHAGRKGWNLHPRWEDHESFMKWDGEKYVDTETKTPLQGQRPIVVLVGDKGEDVITQFVEFNGEIVGANIIAGEQSSPATVATAIGSAGAVVYNSEENGAIAVKSASFVKDGKSFIVLNANDEAVAAAVKSGATLYGAHFNAFSTQGTAAVYSGMITSASIPAAAGALSVKVGETSIIGNDPDNLTFPPSKIILFDPKSSAKYSTKEEAATLLVGETDTKKEVLIKTMLESVKIGHATSAAQLAGLLN